MKYSGIIAIIVYSVILYLILKLSGKKNGDTKTETIIEETERVEVERLDPEDEDATVACLVAAIDCRSQYHKNVQIIGVRRIS
ncbi:MAG: hypothetical protein IIZ80_05760 [Erysipelotrichaceae bacterium]|nr:hypothetical protein [Erysipelotrichaceae bacterium]